MASPLSLRVDVDMSTLVNAARDAGSSVDDLATSFEGVESSAGTASTASTTSLGKISTEAQTASTEVEGVGTSADGVGTQLGGLGGIADSVLAGDFTSAAQTAGGALDNLAGMAGIGGPVAVALTTLAQLVGSAFTEAADRVREKSSGMFDAMTESGSQALDQTYLLAQAQELIADDKAMEKIRRWSSAIGLDLPTAILASVGSTEDLKRAQDKLAEAYDKDPGAKLAGGFIEATKALNETGEAATTAKSKFDAFSGVKSLLDDNAKAADTAKTSVQKFQDQVMTSLNPAAVKFTVDDSAVKNWRPPMLTIPAQVVVRPGAVQP